MHLFSWQHGRVVSGFFVGLPILLVSLLVQRHPTVVVSYAVKYIEHRSTSWTHTVCAFWPLGYVFLDDNSGLFESCSHPVRGCLWGHALLFRLHRGLTQFQSLLLLPQILGYFFFGYIRVRAVFRWFKFTLKPPNSIALGKLRLAIWDTSFWTFWLKFGHNGPWDIS